MLVVGAKCNTNVPYEQFLHFLFQLKNGCLLAGLADRLPNNLIRKYNCDIQLGSCTTILTVILLLTMTVCTIFDDIGTFAHMTLVSYDFLCHVLNIIITC